MRPIRYMTSSEREREKERERERKREREAYGYLFREYNNDKRDIRLA